MLDPSNMQSCIGLDFPHGIAPLAESIYRSKGFAFMVMRTSRYVWIYEIYLSASEVTGYFQAIPTCWPGSSPGDLSIDHYRSFMSNAIVQNYYQAHPTPIYVMLQNLQNQTGAG